jgi:hypothetical protein
MPVYLLTEISSHAMKKLSPAAQIEKLVGG